MWKRLIPWTTELAGQLSSTNYHIINVKLFGILKLNNIYLDRFKNKFENASFLSDRNVNQLYCDSITVGRACGLIGYSEVRRMYPRHALKMDYSKAYWTRKGHYQIQNLGHAFGLLLLPIFQTAGEYLLKYVLPTRRYLYSCISGFNKQQINILNVDMQNKR